MFNTIKPYTALSFKEQYQEKLLDPRWQKVRLKVFERDKWTCKCCGATDKTLHIHHKDYLGIEPWEYPLDMLITLCNICHEKERGREKIEKHLVSTLKMNGFLLSDLLGLSCKLETDVDFTKTLLKVLRNFQNG